MVERERERDVRDRQKKKRKKKREILVPSCIKLQWLTSKTEINQPVIYGFLSLDEKHTEIRKQ